MFKTNLHEGVDHHPPRSLLTLSTISRRTFQLVPMLGFASTVVAGWEFMVVFLMYVLIDGGPPALFWGSIIAAFGFSFVYASMAEMASM